MTVLSWVISMKNYLDSAFSFYLNPVGVRKANGVKVHVLEGRNSQQNSYQFLWHNGKFLGVWVFESSCQGNPGDCDGQDWDVSSCFVLAPVDNNIRLSHRIVPHLYQRIMHIVYHLAQII